MLLCLIPTVAWGEECQVGPRPPGTDLRSLSGLKSLSGREFDVKFMKQMYQLHSDTQALAETELKSTMDMGLRQLSNNIKREQYDLNKKLEAWYSRDTGTRLSDYCIDSNLEFQQLQQANWRIFDTVYVDIMLDYLRRAKDASVLLLSKSSNADLRSQAGIVIKTSDREIAALQRWQNNQPMFD
jgi:uncharacterized protein (DUF305 family)